MESGLSRQHAPTESLARPAKARGIIYPGVGLGSDSFSNRVRNAVAIHHSFAIGCRGAINSAFIVRNRSTIRLQPADGGVFLFPAKKARHQIAAELDHGGMVGDAEFDLAKFVASLVGSAFLQQLLRGEDDAGVAFVEGGGCFQQYLRLHGHHHRENAEWRPRGIFLAKI